MRRLSFERGKVIWIEIFNNETDINRFIQEWNSMDSEDAPPFFDKVCIYKGKINDMNIKKENLEQAVAWGIGYMCGKHNINMTKKDLRKLSKEGAKIVIDKYVK